MFHFQLFLICMFVTNFTTFDNYDLITGSLCNQRNSLNTDKESMQDKPN